MTLKLYFAPGACSFVPHALLEASGAAFEPVMVKLHKGEHHAPEYKALNPRSQVPVLVDEDQVITQILAIVGYLNDRFPQMGFLPAEPLARARVMETLAWMNNTVHPTFTHVFMPDKFTDDETAQAAVKAHAIEQYRKHLARIEHMVEHAGTPYLLGDRVSFLDAYALTLLRWGGYAGIDPESLPKLWAHVQRVAEAAPVAAAIERERLQLNVYKA